MAYAGACNQVSSVYLPKRPATLKLSISPPLVYNRSWMGTGDRLALAEANLYC